MPVLSRRSALSALAASAVLPMAVTAFARRAHPLRGVQLWSVNAEMQADPAGTLTALKAIGYAVIEGGDTFGMTAQQFRALTDRIGLKCPSIHANMADLVSDADAHIALAKTLGARWLVCSSPQPPVALDPAKPWLTAMTQAMTADAWKVNAGHLAELAPRVAKAGLTLAYHNHSMEFVDQGGYCGYDLIAAASPQLRLEMDLGWVLAAGRDPVATLHQHAGKVDLLHLKDMIVDPAWPTGHRSVALGEGLIDWKAVLAEAARCGVRQTFVEQEAPFKEPILKSLKTSADYLAKA